MAFKINLPFKFGKKKDKDLEEGRVELGGQDMDRKDDINPFGPDSSNPFEDDPEKKEEKIEMDSSNPFEGEISFDDVKDTRQGRKLKGKVVLGIVAVVVVICLGAVIHNLMKPKEDLVKQQQQPQQTRPLASAANENALQTRGIPSNYEDLAKYEKDMREKQKKAEEDAKKKAEAERRKKLKEEQDRLEKERIEREKVIREAQRNQPQYVQTPRVNVNQPQMVGQAPGTYMTQSEATAIKSNVSFGLNLSADNATYVAGTGSNVNRGASYGIQAGTIVPATLLNGLVSDGGSSDVVAQVRQDVYDSLTGQHLLIPQGSKLIGQLAGTNNRRLAVTFNRIILPDGSSIKLPTMRATDKSGYSGMKDKYDTHNPDFFRAALISGVMAYLADEVDNWKDRGNSRTDQYGNTYRTAMNDTVTKITDKITQRADRGANAAPTISIRPGYQFNVFINQDMNAYEYIR